jgi:hypothetical protein
MLRVFMVTQCADKSLYTLVAGITISDGIYLKTLWKTTKKARMAGVSAEIRIRQRFSTCGPRTTSGPR